MRLATVLILGLGMMMQTLPQDGWLQTGGTAKVQPWPKPEPMDVDAVTTWRWTTADDIRMHSLASGIGAEWFKEACLEAHHQWSEEKKACLKRYDDCADKRRVLLTSEDGEKHCVLFPKE